METDTRSKNVVVVLDRTPAVLKEGPDGDIIAQYSPGGAANAVVPKIEVAIAAGYNVQYVTSARTAIEREIAKQTAKTGKPYVFRHDGRKLNLYYTYTDAETYNAAREDFFGAYLWFLMQNQLHSSLLRPFDLEAMRASQRHCANQAGLIRRIAPRGAYVLGEDQQGLFIGSQLERFRPDLKTALFIHSSILDPKKRNTFRGRKAIPRQFLEAIVRAWQGFHAVVTHVPWQQQRVEKLINSFSLSHDRHMPELEAAPVTIVPAEVERNFQKAIETGVVEKWSHVASRYDEVVLAAGRTEPYKNLAASIGFAEQELSQKDGRSSKTLFVLQVVKTRFEIPAYKTAYEQLEKRAKELQAKHDNVVVVEDGSYETILALMANTTIINAPAVEEGLQLMPLEAALVHEIWARKQGRHPKLAIIASDSAGVAHQLKDVERTSIAGGPDGAVKYAVHAHFKDPLRYEQFNVRSLERAYSTVLNMSEADRIRMAATAANQARFNQDPLNHLEKTLAAADRGFDRVNNGRVLQASTLA